MRGKADLQEVALIVINLKPELANTGKLLTGTALAPFSCEKVVIKHEKIEDWSASNLVVPKLLAETTNDEQGLQG